MLAAHVVSLAAVIAALVLSLRMLRHGAGAGGLPGCGAGSACDAVTRSRWSRWLGLPVVAPAALLYLLLLLVLASLVLPDVSPDVSWHGRWRRVGTDLLLAAAPLLAAAAAWFIGLQVLLLRRFCLYCLLLHGIGVAIAALILFDLSGGSGRLAYAGLPASERAWVLSASAAAILLLVLGQVLVRPRTYVVKVSAADGLSGGRPGVNKPAAPPHPPSGKRGEGGEREAGAKSLRASPRGRAGPVATGPAVPAASAPGAAALPNPFTGRVVNAGGGIVLDGGPWPVLGSPEARQVLVLLFCYTCGNCRHLHGLLTEAMERDPRRLSVMLMPVPTDPACNRHVRHCGPEHANACAYARLALSLWSADWARFAAFDRFLFDGGKPPPLAPARARAEALAGRSLDDPRAPAAETDRLIGIGVNLHKRVGSGLTPTLMMPRSYAAGHVPTAGKLEEILEKEVGAVRAAGPAGRSVTAAGFNLGIPFK